MLDKMRELADMPLRITSGSRCLKHNVAVGGNSKSAHMAGLAVDIGIEDSGARFRVVAAAVRAGFPRIGVGSGLVHVDVDDTKPQNVLWLYGG